MDVGGEERRPAGVLADLGHLHGREVAGAPGHHHEQRDGGDRQDPAGAAGVEARRSRPGPGRDLADQQRGDQEAGEDEEDVDADETAGNGLETGVVGDDEQDRQGAQALHVGAVPHRCGVGSGGEHARHTRTGAPPLHGAAVPDYPGLQQYVAARFRRLSYEYVLLMVGGASTAITPSSVTRNIVL